MKKKERKPLLFVSFYGDVVGAWNETASWQGEEKRKKENCC